MCFLFRLDLSLYAGARFFFGILIFGTKHGVDEERIMTIETASMPILQQQYYKSLQNKIIACHI